MALQANVVVIIAQFLPDYFLYITPLQRPMLVTVCGLLYGIALESVVIIYVHAYDIFDVGETWGRHRGVRDLVHIVLRPRDSVQTMVQRIITAAGSEGSIYTLIINAHGLTTALGVPVGRISLSDSATLSAASAVHMERLRPYFSSPCNGLELHCCEVLGAGDGWTLCRALARGLQVSVYASTALQRGISPWYSSTPSDTMGQFEGRTYRFHPNGTYTNVVEELRSRGLHE